MKNLFKKAHEMTRKMKERYPEVDYQAQFGLCLSYLLEKEREEGNMKIEMKELKGTEKQIKFANDIKEATLEIVNQFERAIEQYSKHDAMREKHMQRLEKVKDLFESYREAGKFIEDWKEVIYAEAKSERVLIIADKLEKKGIKITWRILGKLQEEYITY